MWHAIITYGEQPNGSYYNLPVFDAIPKKKYRSFSFEEWYEEWRDKINNPNGKTGYWLELYEVSEKVTNDESFADMLYWEIIRSSPPTLEDFQIREINEAYFCMLDNPEIVSTIIPLYESNNR